MLNNVFNLKTALMASQVYAATGFNFQINEPNFNFRLMSPFYFQINEPLE